MGQSKREDFRVKACEVAFRDKGWFDFAGNLYRNLAEIPTLLANFSTNSSDTILEVGAGSGRITKELVRTGAEVVALDLSTKSLKINRRRSKAQTILADACFLPFTQATFSKVAAISVIEHIPSTESRIQALKEIKRVCKKGGSFLVEVQNRRFYEEHRKDHEVYYRGSLHYRRFQWLEFRNLLLSVFPKIVNFKPLLIFHPFMRGRLGSNIKMVKLILILESRVLRKSLAFLVADRLVAVCRN